MHRTNTANIYSADCAADDTSSFSKCTLRWFMKQMTSSWTKKSASNAGNTSLGKPGCCSPLGDGKWILMSDLAMVILQPSKTLKSLCGKKGRWIRVWKVWELNNCMMNCSWTGVWSFVLQGAHRQGMPDSASYQWVTPKCWLSLHAGDSGFLFVSLGSPFGRSLRASPVSCWNSYVLLYEI